MKKVMVSDEIFDAVVNSGKTVDEILKAALEVKQEETKPSGDLITKEGVVFQEGTAFLSWFKDRAYYGNVIEGQIDVMGDRFSTVSAAAVKITNRPTNGWDFWKCKRPADKDFIKISSLRTPKTRKARICK